MEAIMAMITIWLLGYTVYTSYKDTNTEAELKPTQNLQPQIDKNIWQNLGVLKKFNLKPIPSKYGVAVGSFQGHKLRLEQRVQGNSAVVIIMVTSAVPLRTNKRKPPSVSSAEVATLLAPQLALQRGTIKLDVQDNSLLYQRQHYQLDTFTVDKAINLVADLIDIYPDIMNLGGEVMPTLAKAQKAYPLLRQYITQAMKEIARDTRSRIRPHLSEFICPDCLTRCQAHNLFLPGTIVPNIRYYGCRTCRRSQGFLKGEIVAVVDEAMSKAYETSTNAVRVNALTHQKSIDFDAVEVKQASDEVVERFVIHVSNHLDGVRRKKLSDIRCEVSPTCRLSENTIRILKGTFGKVISK